MGTNDIPPSHVPPSYHFVGTTLLALSGALWTTTYILMFLRSRADRTYSMPLFALAVNVSWELVMGFYVAEAWLETYVICIWLLIDMGLVYNVLLNGPSEWAHTPIVARNLGKIWLGMMVWCSVGFYAFSKWWIDNKIGASPGKIYKGVLEGAPDTTALGFWTAQFAQTNLGVLLVVQLVVRGHSGGHSYAIWACRFVGTVLVQVFSCGYAWWVWPEAHGYWASPFSVFMLVTATGSDLVYLFVMWRVRKQEVVLPDGRKVSKETAAKMRKVR